MAKKSPANEAGRVVEHVLAAVLQGIGLQFAQQVRIGPNIYGHASRVDFVIDNLAAFPDGLIVESKWQDRFGTVDEKFPYLLENIQQCYPLPTIIVVAGGGAKPGAVGWLRSHCDGLKLVAVYSLEGFISWALRSEKRSHDCPCPAAE